MPVERRKILIIENQELQFDGIIGCLNDYSFFPEKEDYVKFIDHVRVWVNELYKEDYREKAIEFILNSINTNEIELILMDHILGGAHHCLTGIDLAKEINQRRINESKTAIPIAFLSKTEHNDEKRVSAYEEYKKTSNISEWIHKGYFGDEILKKDYFNSRVILIIEKLLGATEEQRFWIDFDVVLSLQYPNNQITKKTILADMKNTIKYQDMTEEFKNMIRSVSKSREVNEISLEQ
ncbi:MAG: hypothetical protein KDE33_05400 [Bacteroidetes bacterium]|nr:hypothetical protein [Bacteroidota bacterium]